MDQSLGIEFPLFHFKVGSLGNLNVTTRVLQLIDPKQKGNKSMLNMTSKSKISSSIK